MEEKIKEQIEKLRPYLNMDGGDITFIKYEDHYLFIKLTGACAYCMYKDNDIDESILAFFKNEIPEIEGIINVDL